MWIACTAEGRIHLVSARLDRAHEVARRFLCEVHQVSLAQLQRMHRGIIQLGAIYPHGLSADPETPDPNEVHYRLQL